MSAPASTVEQPKVSRGLLVTLGVVVAVAAAAALWLFVVQPLLLDEPFVAEVPERVTDGADTPAGAEAPAADTEAPPAEEAGADPAAGGEPADSQVLTARDPFQPLVVEADPTAMAAAGTAPTAASGGDTAPAPETVVGATTVRLADVFTRPDGQPVVLVTVDAVSYEVGEGEVFAERFRVLDIAEQCATFLYGDSRFSLCKGEEIRK